MRATYGEGSAAKAAKACALVAVLRPSPS